MKYRFTSILHSITGNINLRFIMGIILLLLLPGSVFAIDIEEVVWGFNNQQTRNQCIPVSILLRNNTPEAFDEPLHLNRLQFDGSRVGAPLVRKVFLAPFTSQWVQFYPYISNSYQTDWSLNWGPGFLSGKKLTRAVFRCLPLLRHALVPSGFRR